MIVACNLRFTCAYQIGPCQNRENEVKLSNLVKPLNSQANRWSGAHIDEDVFGQILHLATSRRKGIAHVLLGRGQGHGITAHLD